MTIGGQRSDFDMGMALLMRSSPPPRAACPKNRPIVARAFFQLNCVAILSEIRGIGGRAGWLERN